jgi:hypothetical protein
MKRKELVNLAKKIAKYEKIIQTGTDKEVAQAQDQIMELSRHIGRVGSTEDLIIIDELVMEMLEEKN